MGTCKCKYKCVNNLGRKRKKVRRKILDPTQWIEVPQQKLNKKKRNKRKTDRKKFKAAIKAKRKELTRQWY